MNKEYFKKTDYLNKYALFKYGEIKYLRQTLEDCILGFSRLSDYNDVFEKHFMCRYRFGSEESRNDFMDRIFKSGLDGSEINRVTSIADEYLSKFVVTCFSLTAKEPLMWAHYADNHSGICYWFNSIKPFDTEHYRLGDVGYSSKLPVLDFYEDMSTFEQLRPQLDDVILTKSDNWAYEKEFRFYIESSERAHRFNPKSLSAVIVGIRARDYIDEIAHLVDGFNKKHSTDVKVFYSCMSQTSYEVDIKDKPADGVSFVVPLYNQNCDPLLVNKENHVTSPG